MQIFSVNTAEGHDPYSDTASACGILVSASGKLNPLCIRVTAGGVTQVYNIDCWD